MSEKYCRLDEELLNLEENEFKNILTFSFFIIIYFSKRRTIQ